MRRQRKSKAVVVNEDTAHGADGNRGTGGKRSRKGHKGERANPRAKRTKEPSGKKKGAKVEETAKEDRVEEPIKEKMFVSKAGVRCFRFGLVQRNATRRGTAYANLRCLKKSNLPSPRRRILPLHIPRQQADGSPSDPSAPRYQPPYCSATCRTPSEHAECSCHGHCSRIACGSRPRRTRGIHLSHSAWNT